MPGRRHASLTVIIPAYNEEKNLESTVNTALDLLPERVDDFEILLIDDGSADRTPEIADRLAAADARIRAIHNRPNRGLGFNFAKGVELARKDYVMLLHGDNETSRETVAFIFDQLGGADVIIPWTANPEVRPWTRRVVSSLFTRLVHWAGGLRLHYYNGPCVFRTELVRRVPMTTSGFAYMALTLVRVIHLGASYLEIPMFLRKREFGSTAAFRMANVKTVLKALWELFRERRVRPASRPSSPIPPKRP